MFILIEVADREINAERYNTYEEAKYAMDEYYNEAGACHEGKKYEWGAWKNDTAFAHANYDWKIIEL